MNLRQEFVMKSLAGANHSQLCESYGISRKTGYKWIARYQEEGLRGMADQSRRPKSHARQLEEPVICEMIKLKNAHQNWGPKKIRELYRRKHGEAGLPALSSFKRVFERSGLTKKRRKRHAPQPGRITSEKKAQKPNDVWTIDFKGWWMGQAGKRIEPLTVRDEWSRKILAIALLPSTRTIHVKDYFKELFERYGLPEAIRSDNGSPFASGNSLLGLTKLSVWWLSLGIELIRGRPGCPQDNGSHERMHQDILIELQREGVGYDPEAFEIWRKEYNGIRPHESLGMKTPNEVYQKSSRRIETMGKFDKYEGLHARRVMKGGAVKYCNESYFLSTALSGYHVGLKAITKDDLEVYFGQMLIGEIDHATRSFNGLRPQAVEAGKEPEEMTP